MFPYGQLMTKFENHTPHAVSFFRIGDVVAEGRGFKLINDAAKAFMSVESGDVVRVAMTTADIAADWDGVPVRFLGIGEVDALPAPQDGVIHIVALPCAEQYLAQGRRDVAVVDRPVVNSAGRIVGCLGLSLVTR